MKTRFFSFPPYSPAAAAAIVPPHAAATAAARAAHFNPYSDYP